MKFAVAIIVVGLVTLSTGAVTKVTPSLASVLATKGTANVIVTFDGTDSVLGQVKSKSFASRSQKISHMRSSLLSHAQQSQKNAISVLLQNGVEYTSFWINNRIFIENAGRETVQALSAIREVSEIREEKILEIVNPVESRPVASRPKDNEWGIVDIQAPEAWAAGYDGSGVVIATIDTGVRYTHEALVNNFRQDHGWRDPYPATDTPEPTDRNGHGTHVTANIVGGFGVGVAPGAQWIACRGCAAISCTEAALTTCGEFVTCPTNPDGSDPRPDLAPQVVSNSWGGGQNDPFYNPIISAWNVAGIIPVFAIGNSGPFCETANSPGDQNIGLIAVGSTNDERIVSLFSSRGPTVNGDIKPDVCAPGSAITSASNDADDAYQSLSGTSMAAPHASGVVAVLLSANPDLEFDQVFDILKEHNDRHLNEDVRQCGVDNPPNYPNHSYGYGKVNALKAAEAAAARRS